MMVTKEKIKNFIITELISDGNMTELADTTLLIDSGIIDSLGIMSLLGFLEASFSVQISGEDLIPENFASIASISDLIAQKSSFG
ncbi:acyl carrier protein [Desulfuromonas soudanensis]|uniref:Acyl carrier protein n=1 Tax=Desulfuromonas soudanensis TaxID=1603606 RepID=A0A0M4CXD1_9BACT|nr:acyl carrier protein [Desulfuromonas soudanensis]ALC16866.1 acyl carrier protein [Desulfuromonas soudanensis]